MYWVKKKKEKKNVIPHTLYGRIQGHKSGPRVLKRLTFWHLALGSKTAHAEKETIQNGRSGLLVMMPAKPRLLRLTLRSQVILGTGAS